MNKKAISPLIATILLIAISVALGGVVMSWGEAYIEEKAEFVQGVQEISSPCSAVSFKLIRVKQVPQICQKGNIIEAWLDNGPDADIYNMQARVLGTSDVFTKDNILNMPLKKAGSEKIEFAIAPVGLIRQIKLTPVIVQSGKESFCQEQELVIEGINPC